MQIEPMRTIIHSEDGGLGEQSVNLGRQPGGLQDQTAATVPHSWLDCQPTQSAAPHPLPPPLAAVYVQNADVQVGLPGYHVLPCLPLAPLPLTARAEAHGLLPLLPTCLAISR